MAASAARAAWPPDSLPTSTARRSGARPRSVDDSGPDVEVGTTEGEVAVEGDGVVVLGTGRSRGHASGGRLHLRLGGGDPGAPGQEGPERLARDGLRLLGEVADSEGGWREGDAGAR